jgi:hypothetical protein
MLKATFFEIGEHASWHPEITKQVLAAGMTVGPKLKSKWVSARCTWPPAAERSHRSSAFRPCSIRRS